MGILRAAPAVKNYIWGGKRLIEEYRYKPLPGTDSIAELWMVSMHPDGVSRVTTMDDQFGYGYDFVEHFKRPDWGHACANLMEFPILIKVIDSGDNLSVQVHPDNAYALSHEGQNGKTEFWYVLNAEPGAGLYIGFKDAISKEEYARRIKDGTLMEVLQFFPVDRGSYYMIPAGTVHAIGKGITLIEVQQNSNVTYRVFDYNRVGADGNKRELHIDKAVEVSELMPYIRPCFRHDLVADSRAFTCELKTGTIEWFKPGTFTAIAFENSAIIEYLLRNGDLKRVLCQATEVYIIPAGMRVRVYLMNANAIFTYIAGADFN